MTSRQKKRRVRAVQRLTEVSPSGCWLWLGSVMRALGYGQYRTSATNLYAHRMVYELLVGDIRPGMELHHTCGVRRCVNPVHLIPLTRKEHANEEQRIQGYNYTWRNRKR